MKNYRPIFSLMHFAAFAASVVLFALLTYSQGACAATSGNVCSSSSGASGSGSGAAPGNCETCISSQIFQTQDEATKIISEMFTAINNVLKQVEQNFFNGVINGSGFQTAITTGIVLYIAMYGVMIFLGIGNYRVWEVVGRLTKLSVVYMMTSPSAWTAFNNWVATPFTGGMNQLIKDFTATAESGTAATTVNLSSGLDPALFEGMFSGSINAILSPQYATAIFSLATTGFFGWCIAMFMAWSVLEFIKLLLNSLIVYAKSIIGLAFLFGIAPIFFIFLLFDRSKQVFFGWFNLVVQFSLRPILLFSFLGFYAHLIDYAAANLLTDPQGTKTDFCWVKWFSMPGALWDTYMWRPTYQGAQHPGDWNDSSFNVMGEPISVLNIIYFAIVCHLGNKFSDVVEVLSADITGGGLGSTVQPADSTVSQGSGRPPGGESLGLDGGLNSTGDITRSIGGGVGRLVSGRKGGRT